jgi:DNA-nicking Smr family endonuclease
MSGRRRKRGLTEEEARLWQQVVHDVAPLPRRRRKAASEDQPEDAAGDGDGAAETPRPVATPPAPPAVSLPPPKPRKRELPGLEHGYTPGVDKRTSQRMTRGRLEIEARIDLHGMGVDAAHGALIRFVETSAGKGRRCVLVITGKGLRGEGILRRQVPRWLNDGRLRPLILGFSHAQPQHGGDGALYVLLRRNR